MNKAAKGHAGRNFLTFAGDRILKKSEFLSKQS